MQSKLLFLGLDIGSSGARAIVIDAEGKIQSSGQCSMTNFSKNHRDPSVWEQAAAKALHLALSRVDTKLIKAISVDGTSGSMIPIDIDGKPLSEASMYNDPCTKKSITEKISKIAPETSAAHGATSGLARAINFENQYQSNCIVHQADWIAGNFCGIYSSDENNALKTGYDPVLRKWPEWIEKTGMDISKLPMVNEPGTVISQITSEFANTYNLSRNVIVVAGTTDGCASFVATGATEIGEGVSALGTTLTIKLLSDHPIFSPQYGIYSHRILGKWLAGGASNTGGNVLLKYFNPEQIAALSTRIDPQLASNLNYYPLPKPGERFPISDPCLQPKLSPRPTKDHMFLQGLFEGIAAIEADGYKRLTELGGPVLTSVRTVGGGASNKVWSTLREKKLNVPLLQPFSNEAAYGTALIARKGVMG